MSFADQIRASLPAALTLPDEFAAVFDWAEARGQTDRFRNATAATFASIYPLDLMNAAGASYVLFHFEGPPLAPPIPPEVAERYATLATAAGDGGRLGLWCDNDGQQQIAIFNHGWPYVLTSDPLTALRFLAIGYPEPAALTDAQLTAEDAAKRDGADKPLPPVALQEFIMMRFGVSTPDRASDLGIVVPPYEDMTDPMRQWLDGFDG